MAVRRKTQVLEPITPQQQSFIEALLTGKSITDAALTAKLSRRAATYWMNDAHHPVRMEYEKQRLASLATVASRVASLHGLAFSALEDLLAPSAPPAVRFQAAKLIYEAHLQGFCEPTPPQSTTELVAKELTGMYEEHQQIGSNQVQMYDDKGKERLYYMVDAYEESED